MYSNQAKIRKDPKPAKVFKLGSKHVWRTTSSLGRGHSTLLNFIAILDLATKKSRNQYVKINALKKLKN